MAHVLRGRAEIDLADRLTTTLIELAQVASPSRSEADCADIVVAMLSSFGLELDRDSAHVAVGGNCDNLHCYIPATRTGDPLFLCAHLDTVPPTAALAPIVVDGVIRNANPGIIGADNKAAVAVLIEVARSLVEDCTPHAGVDLVFTVCEEQGLLGSREFDASVLHARSGFVFDHPGKIGGYVTAAPSRFVLKATIHGRSSHAGIAPRDGNNAILALAQALAKLPSPTPEVSVNVGHVGGGTAVNVVPDRAHVAIDIRSIDHARALEITTEIEAILQNTAEAAGCEVEITRDNPYRGYTLTSASAAVRTFRRACAQLGLDDYTIETGGGSDANAFQEAGLDCVNLAHAVVDFHGPDESVAVSDLVLMTQLVLEMIAGSER